MNANTYNMKNYIVYTYLSYWWNILDVYLTMYSKTNTCYFQLFEYQINWWWSFLVLSGS